MGREWLYKATGGGGKAVKSKKAKHKNAWSSGCMSAIYNLFDIQHQQLRFHHPSFMPSDSIHHTSFSLPQGIEAPRNSLESSESAVKVEQTNLNIPVSCSGHLQPKCRSAMVGRMKIKTNRLNFSDETCDSPGTKTPNLVARLMGLDILPEYSSPRPSSSDNLSRSLPATPRLSTASRKSTDNVIHHHRLSLQIDKENYKERIGRRLGTDITNNVSETRSKYQRRDLNLVKDPVRKAKFQLLEMKENVNKPVVKASMEEVKSKQKKKKKVVKDEKIKRMVSERYDLRLKKIKQQEKAPVSNNNYKSTTKNIKEMTSSFSNTTRLSQKQVSLPSNNKSSYNSNDTHNLKPAAATTSTSADSYSFTVLSGRSMGWLSSTAFKAEVEGMVVEIEREIMESLVHEIATC